MIPMPGGQRDSGAIGQVRAATGAPGASALRDTERDRTRGLALFASGRDWEASRALARARAAGISDSELLRKLGWARFTTGDAAAAETALREALAVAPNDWASHYALGVVLRGRDDAAAWVSLTAALEYAPGNVECLLALSSCALAQRDAAGAERFARSALEAGPESRDVWFRLGVALLVGDHIWEAKDAFEHAEHLSEPAEGERPLSLDRGLALRLLGLTREAIDYYEAKLPDVPSAIAHGQYALALLTAGEFRQGWEQYAFRWFDASLADQRATCDRPAWRGEDLSAKTILLRCEQGVGDVLQFIRYAPVVKALGATVLLELRPGLGALAKAFPGIDAICEHGKVARDFDCWCDLLSLPLAFGTTLDTIPAEVPYLRVDDARRATWRNRLADGSVPRIGIVWAGDPRHPRDRQRSVSLDLLRSLFALDGLRWFSLQKGPAAAALESADLERTVVDLDRELGDYADTAAAIDALDLVVTVDTSVAHLAGALGKPVWVLLPALADWRWLEGREDSLWYPTMRLFRQRNPGDWPEVVSRVADAIDALRNAFPTARLGVESGLQPPAHPGVAPRPQPPAHLHRRPGSSEARVARACFTRVGWMQCPPSTDAAARSLEHYGEYLLAQVDLLLRIVPRGAVVAEFGAGFGYHAIALAPLAGREGQVLAIEGSRVLRVMLRQNVEVSGVHGVSIMPANVTNMGLDALDFERLDLLKINGSAYADRLLVEAEATLWKLRPAIFAAQPSREALDALASRMVDFGYRCWCVDTPMFDPSNFNRREDDVFDGAHALALLALPEEREFELPPHGATRIAPVTV